MYIPQKQLENLKNSITSGKVIVIYGPRRCGKTTLLKHFLDGFKEKFLFVSGEDITVQEYLGSQSIEKLKNFIGDNKLIAIDEAQRINNIGLNLKLIVDHIGAIKVVATGSSAFDLARALGEPLTGRKYTLRLFPLAQMEIGQTEAHHETEARLESRLIFGSYPEVVTNHDDNARVRYLKEIVGSYLYKDILELEGVRHPDKIVRLLQLLAFQIGAEVSLSELGGQLGMSKNTVERYLDLLEKSFVILRLSGLSRNRRKEISKSHRYYFYDNGIRNALINNFNPITMRNDIGMLWENYIVLEMIKRQEYSERAANNYFWRTYDQKEIDFVVEEAGKLSAYEIKWQVDSKNPPALWREYYPGASYACITRYNYLEFVV